jgi:Uncharacterized protein conserved in bacteria (DUF2171)
MDTSKIKPHMEIMGADGVHVGTVDHIEGRRIKMTKDDSGQGHQPPIITTSISAWWRTSKATRFVFPPMATLPSPSKSTEESRQAVVQGAIFVARAPLFRRIIGGLAQVLHLKI